MSDFLVGLTAVTCVAWYILYQVSKCIPRAVRGWVIPRKTASIRDVVRHPIWKRTEQPKKAVAEAPAATSGVSMRPFVLYKGAPREVLKRSSLGDTVQCVLRPDTAGGCRPCVVVPRDQVLWLPK